jgi:hypothetical protein
MIFERIVAVTISASTTTAKITTRTSPSRSQWRSGLRSKIAHPIRTEL